MHVFTVLFTLSLSTGADRDGTCYPISSLHKLQIRQGRYTSMDSMDSTAKASDVSTIGTVREASSSSSSVDPPTSIHYRDAALDIFVSILVNGVIMVGSYYGSRWLIRSLFHRDERLGGDEFRSHSLNSDTKTRLVNILLRRIQWQQHMQQRLLENVEDEEKEDDDVSSETEQHLVKRKSSATREDVIQQKHVQSDISRTLSNLNEYERIIAQDVIDPSDMATTFADVGGIDSIKMELWELVVFPLIRPDLFMSESGLVSPPKGILLCTYDFNFVCSLPFLFLIVHTIILFFFVYFLSFALWIDGAPGTGKTMLAKAIAKESHATFVNVRLSSIMDKWFGESNKLIAATFSLAKKLAPSVIFIDEIDTFLSQRDSGEGSAIATMKSEFLTLWDGMTTDAAGSTNNDIRSSKNRNGPHWQTYSSPPVIVLGATNRPYDVDTAILRRLPRTFEIGLPDLNSRIQILHLFLEKHSLTEEARKFIPALAKLTEGYSGSDLKELCRAAAMQPIREMTSNTAYRAVMGPKTTGRISNEIPDKEELHHTEESNNLSSPHLVKVRPVNERDFAAALKKVKKSGEDARNYWKRQHSSFGTTEAFSKISRQETEPMANGISMDDVMKSVQILKSLMQTMDINLDSNFMETSNSDDEAIPDITSE